MHPTKEQHLETMASSTPLSGQEGYRSGGERLAQNIDSQGENNGRTVTRFPPLIKSKPQQTSCQKESGALVQAKRSGDDSIPLLKKTSMAKKKTDKKKPKLNEVKPQIQQKYRQYSQFLELIRLSNNLQVQNDKIHHYVIYVGKGNNSSLIKTLFRNYRPWWTIEENPANSNVNLHWYQLRQNEILDNFKENPKSESDLLACEIYAEPEEKEPFKQTEFSKIEVGLQRAKPEVVYERVKPELSSERKGSQRSQSVTQKDIHCTLRLTQQKRSSSRAKGGNDESSPMRQIGKDLSQLRQLQEIDNEPTNPRKGNSLANPKMWPIYQSYRRLISRSQLKQLKALNALDQSGRLSKRINRNKRRVLQCRSGYPKSHNHLCNNWNLSNKKALFMNLKNYYDARKTNPFDFIPMTFHVTEPGDKEFGRFLEEFQRRNDLIKEEERAKKGQQLKNGYRQKKRNAWLVKPGENTNRGTGIEVVESLQQIRDIIQRDQVDKLGRARTHIIQEYIMPFLYQKRKFDIRCYILVTSFNGQQKGYWFQDGYIRTASKQFNMKNLNNKYIHLTNDAVQKYHEDYGKFQPGNKLSFADFQRYLDTAVNTDTPSKLRFYHTAYPEMKKLAADAIRSVYTKMDPLKKDFSFEIFGLDFLIDESFKVWLIEANTNPCLQLSCPLLSRLIPGMLQNAFKLVVDTLFPPPPITDLVTLTKKLIFPENPIEDNRFQLIFDEAEEGEELRALLRYAPDVKIYDIEEEEEQYDENDPEERSKPVLVEPNDP